MKPTRPPIIEDEDPWVPNPIEEQPLPSVPDPDPTPLPDPEPPPVDPLPPPVPGDDEDPRNPEFINPVYREQGYLNDAQIMLSISKDNGKTWSEWVPRSMGRVGEYRQRVQWNRLGSSDKLVLRFALSDPAPLTVLDMDVTLEGGKR